MPDPGSGAFFFRPLDIPDPQHRSNFSAHKLIVPHGDNDGPRPVCDEHPNAQLPDELFQQFLQRGL